MVIMVLCEGVSESEGETAVEGEETAVHAVIHTDTHTHTHSHTHTQTDRQTDRQTHTQTDRHRVHWWEDDVLPYMDIITIYGHYYYIWTLLLYMDTR